MFEYIIRYHVVTAGGAGGGGAQHGLAGVVDEAPQVLAQLRGLSAHYRLRAELQVALRRRVECHS